MPKYTYLPMTPEQQEMATEAAVKLLQEAQKHKPMASFEALCTLTAQLAVMLDLDVESAHARILDRYAFFSKDPAVSQLPIKEDHQGDLPEVDEEFEV